MAEPGRRLSAEARQEEIVRAAIDLAGERGVDNVTTQDMANAIGVTQGAIFRHFPTKSTIWLAVIHWVRGRLMSVLDVAAAQGKSPLDSLERMFFAHLGFIERFPAIPRLLFSDQLLRENPALRQLMREVLSGYEAKIAALVAQANAQGLTRPDLDERCAATMFIALIQGLVMQVALLGGKKSLTDEGKGVFPIFLRGVDAKN